MEMSESVGAISAALAKAQSSIGDAEKDSKNPHFRSEFASLQSVLSAVRPSLSAAGVSITQWPSVEGQTVTVTTMLSHESGEWMRSSMSSPYKGPNPAQAIGSAVTYLRRYAVMAACGIAPTDDDGNAVGSQAPPPSKRPPKRPRKLPPKPRPSSHHPSWEADRARFCARLGELGMQYEQVADWCEAVGRPRPSQMDGPARKKVEAYVGSEEGAAKLRDFIASTNGENK